MCVCVCVCVCVRERERERERERAPMLPNWPCAGNRVWKKDTFFNNSRSNQCSTTGATKCLIQHLYLLWERDVARR